MTPHDRVVAAIKHKSTDYAPYQLDMVEAVRKSLESYYNCADFEFSLVGNHLIREKNKKHVYNDDGSYTDLFGVTWDVSVSGGGDIGSVRDLLLQTPSIADLRFPEPDASRIRKQCESMIENHRDYFKIYEINHTLFERAWMLRGYEELLTDLIFEEKFVHALLEGLTDYALKIIDIVSVYPIDCIMFGDDWGTQGGLIMGANLWRKFIGPCMKRLLGSAKSYGYYTCIHSCGDNYEIFGDLIDMGLDIYNTFQPEVYDTHRFVNEYGARLTIYGGISVQSVLPQGAPGDVRHAVAELVRRIGERGGLIVAPAHQITPDVPFENIMAFIDAARMSY